MASSKLVAMTEADAIGRADRPATTASLVSDLRALGLEPGATVMVHSSLSGLGYVAGGPQAVVLALLEAVGDEGTVVMPTHSADLSDPATWRNPAVPEAWWELIRASMPAFDPDLTPARQMGAIVDCFRHLPGVRRSHHPTVSAAAFGPNADTIVSGHELAFGLGESSPQARLYDLDAWALLMGVSHANNTSLHLSEYRSTFPNKPWITSASPVLVDGVRQWVTYDDLDEYDDDFERIGEEFAKTGRERRGPVGAGTGRLFKVRDIVDFGTRWIDAHRGNER